MNNTVRTTTLLNSRENFHHISVCYRVGSESAIIIYGQKMRFQQQAVINVVFVTNQEKNIVNYYAIKLHLNFRVAP